MTPTAQSYNLAFSIKEKARLLGFDLVGIAPAVESKYRDYLRQWLDDGRAGNMAFLTGRFEERVDPGVYMPRAASVVCVAMNYHVSLQDNDNASTKPSGRIARYALGDDYHELIQGRLRELADFIRVQVPGCQTRCGVDTAPVLERELAVRAGIGWQGKNSCVINESIGSWIFLGEVITTAELPFDSPAIDRCGTCTRCIDACPTQAITAPYQLDARKCISYLTIEHRSEIDPDLRKPIGEWLFGCDICQDVCPWNGNAPESVEAGFQPRFPTGTLNPADVLQWSAEDYQKKLKNSAMKRVKLPVLQRNACIVIENQNGG